MKGAINEPNLTKVKEERTIKINVNESNAIGYSLIEPEHPGLPRDFWIVPDKTGPMSHQQLEKVMYNRITNPRFRLLPREHAHPLQRNNLCPSMIP